jgi:CBS domain-containing protein
MNVQDVLSRDPVVIDAERSLEQAAQLMRDEEIGFLPVMSEKKLFGVVTDRDLVTRGIASGKNPKVLTLREVATTGAATCPQDASLEELCGLMERDKIRRVIVVDAARRPVGVVSLGDIAARCPDKALAGETAANIYAGR